MKSLIKKLRTFINRHKVLSGVVVGLFVVVLFVAWSFRSKGSGASETVAVTRGTIVETVSVTGNTVPVESVSLGFGNSGTISHIYSATGKKVYRGQLLAELNTGDLYAQIRQAQANIDTQNAKLAGLRAGARSEDIESSQAAFDKANQDLANMYAAVTDTSLDSYAKATDAVRTQLDGFFSNPDSTNPKLTYQTANPQSQIDAEAGRFSATGSLDTWQPQIVSGLTAPADLETLIKDGLAHLSVVRALLTNVSKTLDTAQGLTATTLATYKLNLTTAVSEVNTASKNLNTASQNIASQKLLVNQLRAQLELKKAGSTPEDIKAQEAQVKSAEANLESIRARLANSQLVAPISGVVTQFDAKVGQLATQGTALVSIISGTQFQVEVGVSETDIGKLTVGNRVVMTLDAFPGETFEGHVFYINPAETVTQGVVEYTVKIAFDMIDPRMKSGLTANLDIETRKAENVLVLPQYAILQNDEGTFVETQEGKVIKQVPVVLGLQDQKGMVEVKSGVSEGQQVFNIGLK